MVCVQFDGQGHRTGVAVLAQEPEQVQVLQAAATNPLDLPLTLLLGSRSPETASPRSAPISRVCSNNDRAVPAATVRDRSGLVQVQCLYKPDLLSDSGVDVLGYPSLANGELILKDAVVLPTGFTDAPGNHIARVFRHSSLPAFVGGGPGHPPIEAERGGTRLSGATGSRGNLLRRPLVVPVCAGRERRNFCHAGPQRNGHSSRPARPSPGGDGGGRFRANSFQGHL